MVQNRETGKELFVDEIGDTLACVVDSSTGETHAAHFFVATLGDQLLPLRRSLPRCKISQMAVSSC